jgi:AcrR family transcriptional regulator
MNEPSTASAAARVTASNARPATGVRLRTRQAIVEAAVSGWARDWGASLADIADRAAVSRSTLHRHFADRDSLVQAAKEHAIGALEDASAQAVVGCDTARDELDALMRATVEVGDAVIYLFADPNRFADLWADDDDASAELRAVIVRAQAEGVVAEAVNAGSLPKRRAGDVASRTFFGGVGAQ